MASEGGGADAVATSSHPHRSFSCSLSQHYIRPLAPWFPFSDHPDHEEPHHLRWERSALFTEMELRVRNTCIPIALRLRGHVGTASPVGERRALGCGFDTRPRWLLLRLDGPSPPFLPLLLLHVLPISILLTPSAPVPAARLANFFVLSRKGQTTSLLRVCQSALLQNGCEGSGRKSPEPW